MRVETLHERNVCAWIPIQISFIPSSLCKKEIVYCCLTATCDVFKICLCCVLCHRKHAVTISNSKFAFWLESMRRQSERGGGGWQWIFKFDVLWNKTNGAKWQLESGWSSSSPLWFLVFCSTHMLLLHCRYCKSPDHTHCSSQCKRFLKHDVWNQFWNFGWNYTSSFASPVLLYNIANLFQIVF